MEPGEPLTAQQIARVESAIEMAEKATGLNFRAFIGGLPDGRATAESMLRQTDEPELTVLVAVDPEARTVDIVTGPEATRWLDVNRCKLAVLTMSSRFNVGDITGGLHDGILVLGEQAARPKVLFTDEPF